PVDILRVDAGVGAGFQDRLERELELAARDRAMSRVFGFADPDDANLIAHRPAIAHGRPLLPSYPWERSKAKTVSRLRAGEAGTGFTTASPLLTLASLAPVGRRVHRTGGPKPGMSSGGACSADD